MSVEAPTGAADNSQDPLLSPRQAEERFRSKNGPHIPRDQQELLWQVLTCTPQEFILDTLSATFDWTSGILERPRLWRDPIYQGKEEPRGDGSAVVILPGFLAPRAWYWDTERFLNKAGYLPVIFQPQVVNGRISFDLVEKTLNFLSEIKDQTGRKVAILAHSLGGYQARLAHLGNPEQFEEAVDPVFLAASPMPEWVNKAVAAFFLATQRRQDLDRLAGMLSNGHEVDDFGPVAVFRLIGRHDVVVKENGNGQKNSQFFFNGSHSNLPADPDVLRFVISRLPQRNGR